MNKFWKWKNVAANEETPASRELFLYGVMAEESWFDDDITPAEFRAELMSGTGPVIIWLDSPGGDVFAAAQLYNMLREYSNSGKGEVEVRIDAIAASAATVVAMAGDKTVISPVAMMMIHNPSMIAWGDREEMKRAMATLDEVKEAIINAYRQKTSLPRDKIARMMDCETWMNATKAVELGFADEILDDRAALDVEEGMAVSMLTSRVQVENSLLDKLAAKFRIETDAEEESDNGRSVDSLMDRLDAIKSFM